MATYIVGDVQGCLPSLQALLAAVRFGAGDTLLGVGDLINRGRHSLDTLRFLRALGPRFATVLGNHDLHFLAMVYGGHPHPAGDTLKPLLAAPDCAQLADWLRRKPLLLEGAGFAAAHAGIPHIWTLADARRHARELESVLAGPRHRAFFRAMYGNEPACWSDALEGAQRWRAIANYFTRMRLIAADGRLEFGHKGGLDGLPAGFLPWFRHPPRIRRTLYFGHWAALDGSTGAARFVGLDTGCVWGRSLTALRLEDQRRFSVPCAEDEREPAAQAPAP